MECPDVFPLKKKNGLNENRKVLGEDFDQTMFIIIASKLKTTSYLDWLLLTSTCFFPNEIGNTEPALQLTDTQLQRAHAAFNMMQI